MPPETATAAPAPAAPPSVPSPAPPPAAWYDGAPADVLTYWQNKGLDTANPRDFALQLTNQARNHERYIGVPAEQLLRLPQPTTPEADRRAFYDKLGVPTQAKDYDFTEVPIPEGVNVDGAYLDGMRQSFHKNNISKDAAAGLLSDLYALEGQQRAQREAADVVRLQQARGQLEREWGTNLEANKALATIGQKKLGINNEEFEGLCYVWGEYKALDVLRMIGASAVTEDDFKEGTHATGAPTTVSGAQAEIDRMRTDQAFVARWMAGQKDAVDYMKYLHQIATGVNPAFESP
jgi:hypothetical protein